MEAELREAAIPLDEGDDQRRDSEGLSVVRGEGYHAAVTKYWRPQRALFERR
jgi:hypothetical protein